MMANRFQWAIDRRPVGPSEIFDVDIYGFDDVNVCPSIGSLVQGWILAIPRTEAICFAELDTSLREQIQSKLSRVRDDLSIFGGKVWTFEHGARFSGSSTACGVDQAHLHVVPLPFNLFAASMHCAAGLKWVEVDARDPWAEIVSKREYYLVSDFAKSYISYPDLQTSQFFRRVIATGLGRPQEWDYRRFRHERNAADTTKRLNQFHRSLAA